MADNAADDQANGEGADPVRSALRRQQATYANAIERLRVLVGLPQFVNTSLVVATNLLDQLADFSLKFEQKHLELLAQVPMNDAEYRQQDEHFADVIGKAMIVRNALQTRIAALTPISETRTQGPLRVELRTSDLLPTQSTWGTFDGQLISWQSFRDKFRAAVHTNQSITPVYKLQYLLAALRGPAAKVVGSRLPTEAGYKGAWDRLCQVYDDTYMLVQSILRTLLNMPSMDSPSYDGLRQLVDTVQDAVRQLATLKVPVQHWDQMLVHMVVFRLDEQTATAWEMQRNDPMPTLQAITTFLDKKAQSMMHLQTDQASRAAHKRKNDGGKQSAPSVKVSKPPLNQVTASAPAMRSCPCCKADHALWKCSEFLGLNLAGRKEAIKKWHLCMNCLREGHEANQCNWQPCARCPNRQKHNSVICPMREPATQAAVKQESQPPVKKKKKSKKENNPPS